MKSKSHDELIKYAAENLGLTLLKQKSEAFPALIDEIYVDRMGLFKYKKSELTAFCEAVEKFKEMNDG